MMIRCLLASAVFLVTSAAHAQGLPPLGQTPEPKPAQSAPALAPLGGLSVQAVNADLKTARAANQEKRYSDAETLMLRDTAQRGDMPYLWLELGTAELGEKKYHEAETSFKSALEQNGGGEAKPASAATGGFYANDGKGTHTGATFSDKVGKSSSPEVEAVSKAGLGEIYVHAGKVADAKAMFDEAAKINPAQAPLYYRNEAIFFLQAGNAVEQTAAAEKAIAIDPTRAVLYFYKGQGLAAQAAVDPKTQKLTLPAGCVEALGKYLDLDPSGQYAADARGILAAAGVPVKPGRK